jgi:hypothetical protein
LAQTAGTGRARTEIWNAVVILLLYCGIGPLVGLVVFAVGLGGGVAVARRSPDGLWLVPFFLIYGLILAHFVGVTSAAVAALAAIGLRFVSGGTPAWIGSASGAAAFAVVGASLAPVAQDALQLEPAAYVLLIAAVHLLAATASWRLARGLLRT